MAFADTLGMMFRIRAENTEAIRALKETEREAEKASGGIRGSFTGAQRSTEGFGSSLLSLRNIMGGAVVGGFIQAAKAGIEYKDTLDKLSISFTSLLGSSQKATEHLKELQEFAARTPFEFLDVAKASQRFQNMGVAAKDVIPLLTAVGNAVAAAGGGSEQIDRVSLALTQMLAKGKVSAQEMNQLAESGVAGWQLLEKQLGKTKAELFTMAEAGQISADTFVKAFRAAHESGDQMAKQMGTLSGSMSTLKDNTLKLLSEAFSPMHEQLRLLTLGAVKLTDQLNKTGKEGQQAGLNIRDGFLAALAAFILFTNRTKEGDLPPGLQRIPKPTEGSIGGIFSEQQAESAKKFLDEQTQVIKGITLIQQGIANVEQELANQAEEAAQKKLERARDALQQAMIAVQNFGKTEGEATENTLKWSLGIRQLSDAVNQLSFVDLIRATKIQIDQKNALELTAKTTEGLKELVKSLGEQFGFQESNVTKVNNAVAEYLRQGGQLNEEMLKLAEHARQLARLVDVADALERMAKAAEGISIPTPEGLGGGIFAGRQRQEGGPMVSAADNAGIFAPAPDLSFWNQFRIESLDAMKDVENQGQIFHDSLSAVFGGVASAFGGMIQGFLQGEKMSGRVFLAMAKQAMTAIAVESAVRAIFHTAMGFAYMFLNPPLAAAQFTAAKGFAVAAAVAGGLGLAIPGGGGAGAAAGVATGGQGFSPAGGATDQDRTRREARTGGAPDPHQPVFVVQNKVFLDGHQIDEYFSRLMGKPSKSRDAVLGQMGYAPA